MRWDLVLPVGGLIVALALSALAALADKALAYGVASVSGTILAGPAINVLAIVMRTPALAVDGEVMVMGRVPSSAEIEELLAR